MSGKLKWPHFYIKRAVLYLYKSLTFKGLPEHIYNVSSEFINDIVKLIFQEKWCMHIVGQCRLHA